MRYNGGKRKDAELFETRRGGAFLAALSSALLHASTGVYQLGGGIGPFSIESLKGSR